MRSALFSSSLHHQLILLDPGRTASSSIEEPCFTDIADLIAMSTEQRHTFPNIIPPADRINLPAQSLSVSFNHSNNINLGKLLSKQKLLDSDMDRKLLKQACTSDEMCCGKSMAGLRTLCSSGTFDRTSWLNIDSITHKIALLHRAEPDMSSGTSLRTRLGTSKPGPAHPFVAQHQCRGLCC